METLPLLWDICQNSLLFSPERAYVILALVPTSLSVTAVVRMIKINWLALLQILIPDTHSGER